ncbi:MAG: metallophosphoesterase family protein [Candidatus Hodarchaeales archaeon]
MTYTLAVISDIHANVTALDEVLKDIKKNFQKIKEFYCPGDLVGYGPEPRTVIERILKEKKLTVVTKGNHDHAVGGGGRDKTNINSYIDKFNPYAQKAIRKHAEILSEEEKSFLYQLPNSRTCIHQNYDDKRITVIHGSPAYPLDEYILPNSAQQKDLFPFMDLFELSILILGHTHIPFIEKSTSNETGREMLMLNSGSIGQPRDKDPRASYAVIDVENFTAEIVRVEYDIDLVYRKIKELGLPEFLGERLYKGM